MAISRDAEGTDAGLDAVGSAEESQQHVAGRAVALGGIVRQHLPEGHAGPAGEAVADGAVAAFGDVFASADGNRVVEGEAAFVHGAEHHHRDGEFVDALHREALGGVEGGGFTGFEVQGVDAEVAVEGLGDEFEVCGEILRVGWG